jgi:hypothetical protein
LTRVAAPGLLPRRMEPRAPACACGESKRRLRYPDVVTLSEERVPLEDRVLVADGQPADHVLEKLRSGLPAIWPVTTRCLLLLYAYADVPLGKRFDVVFPRSAPEQVVRAPSVIVAVTQQFGKPFDSIPHGWKTVTLVDFPSGVPPLIDRMPRVEEFAQSPLCVGFATEETWRALTRSPTRRP